MDNNFALAMINNDKEVLNKITQYENELKQKVGKDIVLIAYTKESSR